MTLPRQTLCTLGGHLPLQLAERLISVIGTAAEDAGYTEVGIDADGRIIGTPPRQRSHTEQPTAAEQATAP